jgi:hypothetical protein
MEMLFQMWRVILFDAGESYFVDDEKMMKTIHVLYIFFVISHKVFKMIIINNILHKIFIFVYTCIFAMFKTLYSIITNIPFFL